MCDLILCRGAMFLCDIFWCIWCGFCDPHEPTQVSPLSSRVSHRARIEPGEWLNTPSSSPREATPTHGGSWGSARRPLPHLQTTEATGFSDFSNAFSFFSYSFLFKALMGVARFGDSPDWDWGQKTIIWRFGPCSWEHPEILSTKTRTINLPSLKNFGM